MDITPDVQIIAMRDKVVVQDVPTTFGTQVGGLQQNATTTQVGSGNDIFLIDPQRGIHLGAALFVNAPFSVDLQGNLIATSATISGTITASTGSIGGFDIGSDYIRDAANSFGLASTVTGGDDVRFWAGDTFANRATAPLRITEAGAITATNIVATGTINATGGYVGSTTALIYESQGINTGTTGHIRGGQTDYSTGTGYFLGYSGGDYKFSIGDGGVSQYMEWDGTNLTVNGTSLSLQNEFGDGSDGSVTISGDTTLTRDMFYTTLTVNSGINLNTAGYRIFCKTSCTVNGTIRNNGNNGSNGSDGSGTTAGTGGAGGTGVTAGSLAGSETPPTGGAGGAGGNGNNQGAQPPAASAASAETALFTAQGLAGVAGGRGGSGNQSAGLAGTVGAATSGTASGTKPRTSTLATLMIETGGTIEQISSQNAPSASSGGSGGGSSTGSQGGGGGGAGGAGSNAGIVVVVAPTITIGASGKIQAKGGTGGNGGNGAAASGANPAGGGGGGGGGNGGGGGVVVMIYKSLANSGSVDVSGGTGGTGGSGGAASGGGGTSNSGATGTTGNSGSTVSLQI